MDQEPATISQNLSQSFELEENNKLLTSSTSFSCPTNKNKTPSTPIRSPHNENKNDVSIVEITPKLNSKKGFISSKDIGLHITDFLTSKRFAIPSTCKLYQHVQEEFLRVNKDKNLNKIPKNCFEIINNTYYLFGTVMQPSKSDKKYYQTSFDHTILPSINVDIHLLLHYIEVYNSLTIEDEYVISPPNTCKKLKISTESSTSIQKDFKSSFLNENNKFLF